MRIRWTEPAVIDLENIRDYISRDSEYYGLIVVERIFDAVEKLSRFPNIGREVSEINNPNIREILLNNYRIIYKVDEDYILILIIVHGARDLKNMKPWEF
ncbi:addiction module toxin, RelE/StbE family [Proteiniborus ethanoligenes]|uniref:Addiction module toxin, RelE/StbE family n=1 Tax=Proteiniborus ethanoligenes TaxID=415015 RepID=A0A1H3KMH2_9FIRM|nr:type II toxin-antitoxin system RelE/ParE family toxin [Proteiniborus ethanoligenes]SDY53229.1 addiction module toxin, RelE/StbE family [Proteiniborus ethanoligenes]